MAEYTLRFDSGVRPAAVAGMFYPADAVELSRQVGGLLDRFEPPGDTLPRPGFPKALIVPHAGYVYSGATAGSAYDLLRPARGVVQRVVLLGPCHRVAARGLALPRATMLQTPLGQVTVNQAALAQLRDMSQVVVSDEVHAQEHSLEVQLPFLQAVLGNVSVVPLAVGAVTPEAVAEVIDRLWGGPETLIVVSTDLSHYLPYAQAQALDRSTVSAILACDAQITHRQACGATPLSGLLLAAARRGLRPSLIEACNSGDTAGDRNRVVGYAAFAIGESVEPYSAEQGRAALAVARAAIGAKLGLNAQPQVKAESWWLEQRATFVTLNLDGALRGCIGSLEPHRRLLDDIAHNACAAAFQDPRFKPLSREEFARVSVELSVLSIPRRVPFASHAELLGKLNPGSDGLILQCGDRRGTFLPQVWEQIPQPEDFLAQLKRKAGLPSETPTEQCVIRRYCVVKWKEGDFASPAASAN